MGNQLRPPPSLPCLPCLYSLVLSLVIFSNRCHKFPAEPSSQLGPLFLQILLAKGWKKNN